MLLKYLVQLFDHFFTNPLHFTRARQRTCNKWTKFTQPCLPDTKLIYNCSTCLWSTNECITDWITWLNLCTYLASSSSASTSVIERRRRRGTVLERWSRKSHQLSTLFLLSCYRRTLASYNDRVTVSLSSQLIILIQGPPKRFFLGCVISHWTLCGITQPGKTFLAGPVVKLSRWKWHFSEVPIDQSHSRS